MVPLLLMRMKVMIAISSSGTGLPANCSENTSLGLGQGTVVEMRTVMYDTRKLPKMKVSLSRKIHIMGLPQGTPLNTRWSEETSATALRQPRGGVSVPAVAGPVMASFIFMARPSVQSVADEQIASPRSLETSSAYNTTQTASR